MRILVIEPKYTEGSNSSFWHFILQRFLPYVVYGGPPTANKALVVLVQVKMIIMFWCKLIEKTFLLVNSIIYTQV